MEVVEMERIPARVLLITTFVLFAAIGTASVFAAPATSFSGQATVVNATVLGIKTVVGDTGALPSSGGDLSSSVAAVNIPNLLTAGVGQASTTGQGNQSSSSASVTDLALSVLGIPISATAVQSDAQASCNAGNPVVSGSSQLADLVINGQPIAVATPNLAISLPAGVRVVVDEQTSSTSGTSGQITVNALHVTAPLIDVVVASSQAGITC
jgi:hypothetical protein